MRMYNSSGSQVKVQKNRPFNYLEKQTTTDVAIARCCHNGQYFKNPRRLCVAGTCVSPGDSPRRESCTSCGFRSKPKAAVPLFLVLATFRTRVRLPVTVPVFLVSADLRANVKLPATILLNCSVDNLCETSTGPVIPGNRTN